MSEENTELSSSSTEENKTVNVNQAHLDAEAFWKNYPLKMEDTKIQAFSS